MTGRKLEKGDKGAAQQKTMCLCYFVYCHVTMISGCSSSTVQARKKDVEVKLVRGHD